MVYDSQVAVDMYQSFVELYAKHHFMELRVLTSPVDVNAWYTRRTVVLNRYFFKELCSVGAE